MKTYSFCKRSLDLIFAILALIVLAPLFVVIALVIHVDSPGPIFYAANRVGKNRKHFKCFKFRTMQMGAEVQVQSLLHLNKYGTHAFVKIENDPRVTKVGKFLRKTSLDEIPQFINVLLGNMSIVGNRPLPIYEAQQLGREHDVRFEAEAGITGLWQVYRNQACANSDEYTYRLRLDRLYTSNRSIKTDLYIMFKTIPALLQKSNS